LGDQARLFKLRQTAGVKRLIERFWTRRHWQAVGHGFDAVKAALQLSGWSRARRVVVLRRRIEGELLAEVVTSGQQMLFADTAKGKLGDYAVLETNTYHPADLDSCRERSDQSDDRQHSQGPRAHSGNCA
jgi:hypothetical protein